MQIKQRPEDFVVEEVPLKNKEGEYTVFWLEKTNLDMNYALRILSRHLNLSLKYFGIAGTKDKRAVTRQRISVYDPRDEAYEKLKELRVKNIRVYNVSKGGRIRLGDLKGNKFTITIRNIKLPQKEIRSRFCKIFGQIKNGIPNYFGPQRFGEVRPISHIVGRYILKRDFEAAVKTYLCERFEGEPQDSLKAREFLLRNWNVTGFKKALGMFPKRLAYERFLLKSVINRGDFKEALKVFPRNMLKMFINAYQSYIWNKVAEFCEENKLRPRLIPLPGCNTRLGKGKADKKIKELLDEEGINLGMFFVEELKISAYGSDRLYLLKPKNMKVIRIGKDEYNKGRNSAKIEFELPKGSYATVVLEKVLACLR